MIQSTNNTPLCRKLTLSSKNNLVNVPLSVVTVKNVALNIFDTPFWHQQHEAMSLLSEFWATCWGEWSYVYYRTGFERLAVSSISWDINSWGVSLLEPRDHDIKIKLPHREVHVKKRNWRLVSLHPRTRLLFNIYVKLSEDTQHRANTLLSSLVRNQQYFSKNFCK